MKCTCTALRRGWEWEEREEEEVNWSTKHLMTGPIGNCEFGFLSTSMFHLALSRGTVRVSGKQNSLFPLGPVIKCLLNNRKLLDARN